MKIQLINKMYINKIFVYKNEGKTYIQKRIYNFCTQNVSWVDFRIY